MNTNLITIIININNNSFTTNNNNSFTTNNNNILILF